MAHPFEKLEFDILWQTTLYFEIFDGEAKLSVYGEESGPEEWQQSLFDKFYVSQGELKPKIYLAIFNYYQSVAPEYRAQLGDDYLDYAPDIQDVSEIKRLLVPDSIFISDSSPENEAIGILFECSWEPEHGLGVLVKHGNIEEIGFQDICL